MSKISKILRKNRHYLHTLPNVVAVGRGFKYINGKKTDQQCIVVSVKKKVPLESLDVMTESVPNFVDGIVTDVQETGEFTAWGYKERYRPIQPGISIGHKDISAGTFGALVSLDGNPMILSNNHVLANCNKGNPGDEILQPGPYDGGTVSNDVAGRLYDYVPIEFYPIEPPPPPPPDPCGVAEIIVDVLNGVARLFSRNTRIGVLNDNGEVPENVVDAAIARPVVDAITEIIDLGIPVGMTDAYLGMEVQKSGRTSGYTTGVVEQLEVSTLVGYGEFGYALFVDQIMTGLVGEPGDSGSSLLDMDKNLVGLLFAGSDTNTLFNPIFDVFHELNLSILR